jgi:GDPmannose 4,6-dehydratase
MDTTSNKIAIITGVTGQMGSYFSDYLLAKGFTVVGAVRRLSVPNKQNIEHIKNPNFILESMDLGDSHSIESLILKYRPHYFINCAANSFVGSSWDYPEQHFEFNALGVLRQLEAIRKHSPQTRYINFGSSEEFGDVLYSPQDNNHPPRARSPYGASKIAARQIVKVYRESYNLYAIQCWCFNYESERRGEEFVTRKITKGIGKIVSAIENGKSFEPIRLGNMDAKRDWSHSEDFVEGVWRMLNQDVYRLPLGQIGLFKGAPQTDLVKNIKEYVLSSNETHSVREFVERALTYADLDGKWVGEGLDEKYITNKGNLTIVEVNPKYFRPAEVDLLLGDSTPARKELGWKPNNSFDKLVKRMILNDLPNEKKEREEAKS